MKEHAHTQYCQVADSELADMQTSSNSQAQAFPQRWKQIIGLGHFFRFPLFFFSFMEVTFQQFFLLLFSFHIVTTLSIKKKSFMKDP